MLVKIKITGSPHGEWGEVVDLDDAIANDMIAKRSASYVGKVTIEPPAAKATEETIPAGDEPKPAKKLKRTVPPAE